MSGSVNKVILIGHLGKDPEKRSLGNNGDVVSFSLATTESWRDKASSERKSKTEWHNVVIFNEGIGKIADQYLRKGSKVFVEGKLTTRKWQDRDGNDKYTTEVVLERFNGMLTLLDGRDDSGDDRRGGRDRDRDDDRGGRGGRSGGSSRNDSSYGGGLDDDIPF